MEKDERTDYEGQADELEGRADEMAEPVGDLEKDVKKTRQDWESKKSDSQVPGAMENPRTEDELDAPVPGVDSPEAPALEDDEDEDEAPRSDDQADAGQ